MKAPHVTRNGGWVSIDICICQEMAELWAMGIKTLNSCCGHNKVLPSVIVEPEDAKRMEELGYSRCLSINDHDLSKTFTYYCKSV